MAAPTIPPQVCTLVSSYYAGCQHVVPRRGLLFRCALHGGGVTGEGMSSPSGTAGYGMHMGGGYAAPMGYGGVPMGPGGLGSPMSPYGYASGNTYGGGTAGAFNFAYSPPGLPQQQQYNNLSEHGTAPTCLPVTPVRHMQNGLCPSCQAEERRQAQRRARQREARR